MKLFISGALIVAGRAMLAWAAIWPSPLASVPDELNISAASSDAPPEVLELGVDAAKLELLVFRAPGFNDPIATAMVMRDLDGRLVPLSWLNAVTEPVFFSDMSAAEVSKVLTAIKEHVPSEAVILSWWDLSRRIRTIVQRQAPLDDPFSRGLLTPSDWSSKEDLVQKHQMDLWGRWGSGCDGAVFARFVDALLLDEDRGMEALAQMAGGKQAYIAVHSSDIWKAAAVHPELISIGYRDFPSANGAHG
jgi:hydroxylamine oxidation protein HaoB